MPRIRSLLGAVALTMLLFPALAGAEEGARPDLILIVDASNSMWGQIDGVNKIVIARKAVGGLIDDLPADANVGLIAYGHRREGDCQDIEVLQSIGGVDKEKLKATINGINPKGKTPITSSINAATDLARESDSAAIVLISDGLETCDLDPCAAVRTAKEEGIPFVLHVVGFDIAGEDTAQLECAAQAGDGLYLSAQDAAQLGEALETAYEKPVIPDGRLVVTATADGKLQDVVVRVIDAATGKEAAAGRTYTSSETNPRSIPLDDESYKARVKAVGIKGSPGFEFEFEIVDGSRVEKTFDFSAGEIAVEVTRNGELSDAVVSVYPAGESKQIAGGRTYKAATNNPAVLRVAAGTYDVTIRSVEMRNGSEPRLTDVVVSGGERASLSFDYPSGNLSVGTRRGERLVDSVIRVVDADGKDVGGGRTYESASSNPKTLIVAPGDYTIRISEIRGEKRELPATVVAGETTLITVDLDQPR